MPNSAPYKEQALRTSESVSASMALNNRRAAGLRNLATVSDHELAWLVQDANSHYLSEFSTFMEVHEFMNSYYWPINSEYSRREWIKLARSLAGIHASGSGRRGIAI